MRNLNVWVFGCPVDDGFSNYPSGQKIRWGRFDKAEEQNHGVFYYTIGFDSCSIILVQYGVISGERGYRTFGICIEIYDAEISKESLRDAFLYLKKYLDNEIIPKEKLLHRRGNRLGFATPSFNLITEDLDYWIEDIRKSFLQHFQQHFVPISNQKQNYQIEVSKVVKSTKKDNVTNQDNSRRDSLVKSGKTENKEVKETNEFVSQTKKKQKETEKLPSKDESVTNSKDTFANKSSKSKEQRDDINPIKQEFTKSFFRVYRFKNLLYSIPSIIAVLSLFIAVRNCSRINSLQEGVQNSERIVSQKSSEIDNGQSKKPSNYKNTPWYINCNERFYTVQDGDGLTQITERIEAICGISVSQEVLIQKNRLIFNDSLKYYDIRKGDILNF